MSKRERIKGDRVEREFLSLHKEAGIPCRKVPLSGQTKDYKGDLIIIDYVAEVKARKSGLKTIRDWLGDNDILFFKENHKKSLVILPFDVYINILTNHYNYIKENGNKFE